VSEEWRGYGSRERCPKMGTKQGMGWDRQGIAGHVLGLSLSSILGVILQCRYKYSFMGYYNTVRLIMLF